MLCEPTARVLVAHCAVRTLPLPVTATAEQPAIEFAPSSKFTVPVGDVAVIVAVKVTFAPAVEGLSELASVVVLAVALLLVSESASMKVVLSVESVPAKRIVCVPVEATEKTMLNG